MIKLKMFKKINAIALIFILLAISLSCSKSSRYVDKDKGYEITGPSNWYRYSSEDGVSFTKFNIKKYGNSSISVFIEPLVPQIDSPLNYLNDVFLPMTERMFQEQDNFSIRVENAPFTLERNGYQWATVRYWSAEDNLQVVYITISKSAGVPRL